MTVPTPDQLLSGGAASFKFKAYGDVAEGIILSQTVRQATDPATDKPVFYPSGDPMWQILYTLQTTIHDDTDDDGRRTLYAKGKMLAALRQAREAVGSDKIEDGGWLRVIYTGDGEAKKGLTAPKLFSAEYRRPSDVQLDQQTAPQQTQSIRSMQDPYQAPPAASQQTYQQPPPPASAGPPANSNIPSPEVIQALLNMDPSGTLLKNTYPQFNQQG